MVIQNNHKDTKLVTASGEMTHDSPNVVSDPNDNTSTHSLEAEKEPALSLSKGRSIALVITLTGAAFLNVLSIQSVVIVLPTIGRELDIPGSRLQWIVSSYALTFGCFLLLWGRIADIYGRRMIFIFGSLWVTVMSVANPFVPNEIAFNIFRGLHGLGAAANVPTAIGILGVTFPPGKAKTYAFATYGAGAPLGSIFGNMLSGLIAEYANWKWVFGACSIMAGLVSIAGFILIPADNKAVYSSRRKAATVDWLGAILITTSLIALTFALTEGNVVGWKTPWVSVLIVLSFIIMAAFVRWQIYLERRPEGLPPLVKMSIFKNIRFSAVMVIMCLFFACFNNFLIFATYYYQDYQGLSPLQTMLRFLPTGIGGILVSFVVAFLLSRVPTFFITLTGNTAMTIACLLFAVPIPPSTSYFAYGFIAMFFSVIGADTTWPCLMLFTSQALPREDQAIGGALINASSQFGRAIGLAIGTAVQTTVMANKMGIAVQDVGPILKGDEASLAGLRAANWVNVGFGILTIIVILAFFNTMEIIGKAPEAKPKSKLTTEDGVVNDDSILSKA